IKLGSGRHLVRAQGVLRVLHHLDGQGRSSALPLRPADAAGLESLPADLAVHGRGHGRVPQADGACLMSAIAQAAKSLILKDILCGYWLGIKKMFQPKETINYPNENGPISSRFRGEHALRRYPN